MAGLGKNAYAHVFFISLSKQIVHSNALFCAGKIQN